MSSPFNPSLADPQHAQRFARPPERVTNRATTPGARAEPIPSGAGDSGFDSTGSIRKKNRAKRKPGEPRPSRLPPPPPPGPPQQTGGHTTAQQVAARSSYADAYRPPNTPSRRPPVPIQDAFEPLGLRVGTFVLKPSIDITRGYDTNPSHQPNGKSSYYTVVEPALQLRSQWSRHEYGIDLRGSFSSYDRLSSSNRPTVDGKSFSRIDLSRDTRILTESRFLLSTDYPGSPNIQADITKLPIFMSSGTTVGLAQSFNHLELSAKGSVDRTWYEASKLTDGSTSSNDDRDFNQYGVQARAAYEVMPGVKPFVEFGGDTRRHDQQADRNGFQRDSQSLTPKVGTTFELSRKLTGEVSAGYTMRRYQDPLLQDLRGVVADASLVWEASGLTKATLTASSRAEESVVAGVSGALRRDAGVQIDHSFRRWLIGTLKVGYGFDQYIGNGREDVRTSLGAAITYKLNRNLWLKGEYRYDFMHSNAPNVDYDASAFLLGLKLQR